VSLEALRSELREHVEPGRAEVVAQYLGIKPGGYGEGDVCLGVRVPDVRRVARNHRDLSVDELAELLRSEVHEERLAALILLVRRYPKEPERIYDLYLASTTYVNNWDLIDGSAPHIVGAHLLERPRDVLYRLVGSESVWERRIAVLATFAFIRAGQYDDTLALCERLLGDEHDLIHKATGWMLRDVGKRDRATMVTFVECHRAQMPRTMLRYAIEKLEPAERARLMAR
jgi:3-methyladenine DNA glycosylase AlkD